MTLGWLANILLIWSWYSLGNKRRYALLLGVAGSLLWAWEAYGLGRFDLLSIEIILGSLGFRAWLKWGPDDTPA